ncbi:MAG: nucleoside triphosphate pyrophosphatase [Geminicoccaceae bacterium]
MRLVVEGAPPLVLASRSTARARMLEAAGLVFTTADATIDESSVREALQAEGVSSAEAATTLATLKAQAVSARVASNCIVLGADQILDLDGDWLEKPTDREQARAQLVRLRGRQHGLLSAAVAFLGGSRIWHHVEAAEVRMRPFSDACLDAYLDNAGDAVLQSVGSYQLEGLGAQLMASVRGDFFTVLGLPLLPVLAFLREHDVVPR